MNGHDFTLEQNTEARMMLAVAGAIIDPTGLVARHVATIKPKWD